MQRFLPAKPAGRIALFIVLLSLATLLLTRPTKGGDFQEYALMTIAFAAHGSPDIRLRDVDIAARLSPEPGFVALHARLRAGMQHDEQAPFPGFLHGRDGRYYAIHFFAYSALATIPFKLIDAAGGNPFKAFQVVNLAALAILAGALLQFTGSPGRSMFGVLLFLLSGGMLYANWCSPEFFSACALLAGLVFALRDRPYAAAVLAGIAAMQNPPLVFFAVFAPLIRIAFIHAHAGLSLGAAAGKVLSRHTILASILLVALAALPVAFNLAVLGMPSAIAHYATDPALITSGRLVSFFFDLNQGAIIALPVAMVLVLAQLVARDGRRWLPHTIAALCFSLALALPSLSTLNWNSGSNGLSRYALWGGMPLLYLALGYLQRRQDAGRMPLAILCAIILAQGAAMLHARSYDYLTFSPAARYVLNTFPVLYAPEPEIFVERVMQHDGVLHGGAVAAYPSRAHPMKTVFNAAAPASHAALCGPGRRVADDTAGRSYPGGWRYVDGSPVCVPEAPESALRP